MFAGTGEWKFRSASSEETTCRSLTDDLQEANSAVALLCSAEQLTRIDASFVEEQISVRHKFQCQMFTIEHLKCLNACFEQLLEGGNFLLHRGVSKGVFGEKEFHEKNTSLSVQHGSGSIMLWASAANIAKGSMDSTMKGPNSRSKYYKKL